MNAYEDVFNHTSTAWAPWRIIPADHKWFTRLVIADVIANKLASLDLKYPVLKEEHQQQLIAAKEMLEREPESRAK